MRIFKEKFLRRFKTANEPTSPTDLYTSSSDWFYDMYQSQTVWLRRSLVLVCILGLLLFTSLLSNLFLFPLKEKVPYLYAFNNATGEVTQLGQLGPSQFSGNWQMTRYFIIHYIMNRESYDFDNINYPYQIAWAMSDETIRKQFDAQVTSSSPTSPYKLYGKDKYITVQVFSVNRLSDDTADVRFQKTLSDRTAGSQQVSQEEAIVKWKYTEPETTQKMLDRDPLGFQITYYQGTQVTLDNSNTNPGE